MGINREDVRIRLSAEGLKEVTDAFRKVTKEAERTGKRGAKGFNRLNQSLKTFKKILPSITLIATAAAAGILLLTKRAIDAADNLAKLSEKTGISTETLSKLEFAASQSGINLETLSQRMVNLQRRAKEGDRGVKSYRQAFDKLNISLRDSKGELKGTEELLLDVADRFSKMENGTLKAAIATDIFSNAGVALIPFLNQGREGIKELTDEAERLGLVIDSQTAKAAEKFNDNLDRLKSVVVGVANRIASELLPQLNQLTDSTVDFVTEGEGAERLAQRIAGAFKLIGAAGLIAAFSLNKLNELVSAFAGTGQAEIDFRVIELEMEEEVRRLEALQQRFEQAGTVGEEQLRKLRQQIAEARNEMLAARSLGLRALAEVGPGGGGLDPIFAGVKDLEELGKALEKLFAGVRDEITETGKRAQETGPAIRKIVSDLASVKIKPLDLRPEFDPFAVAGVIKELQEFVAGLDLTLAPKFELPIPPPPEAALLAGLGERVGDQFASGFGRAISQGEELRGVIQGIAQDLVRMLAQRALTSLIGNLFGGFLGGAGGGAGAPGGAGGGLIQGPGSSTSDSIPVRLSRGEYVVRAAVVNEPDVLAYLDRLNREGRPALKRIGHTGFAEGGLVELNGEPARQPANGKADLTIGLDETLLLKRLETNSEFSRVLVRTMDRHRKKFNNALGRGVQ